MPDEDDTPEETAAQTEGPPLTESQRTTREHLDPPPDEEAGDA
jgi:hypothetical protein